MDPQRPPVPYSAAFSPQSQSQSHSQSQPSYYQPSPNTSSDDCDYDYGYGYNEKDAYYSPQQTKHVARAPRPTNRRPHDSLISHPLSPKLSSPPSPTSSVSSAGRRHHSLPAEIQHAPPQVASRGIAYPPVAHLDPEKNGYAPSSQSHRSPNRASGLDADAIVYDQGEYHEKGPEEKAWQLLFYLSGPCALLSLVITFWTVVALLISLALAPLRFCTTRPAISAQLTTLLAPALNLQLHLVYSHNSATGYSSPMLVVIHIFSPIVAFGVAIAAWTAAAFWIFTSILGDPGGNDGHNDGKESILGVRNWWERWLSRGLRETSS
ncbi:hypothetical protein BKA66DRAFT_16786 [Pyrenochaeta sp. MPI-SDFR-AT-0127]|nr:hypothetical protein BKA66DRAFT_16786 [Pyrenochaeta sp. MPI-SDFR-AT-0127]